MGGINILVEVFLSIVFAVVKLFLNLVPNVILPFDSLIGGLAGLIELFSFCNFILPIDTFLVCFGVWLSLEGAKNISIVVNWLIKKIPGVS